MWNSCFYAMQKCKSVCLQYPQNYFKQREGERMWEIKREGYLEKWERREKKVRVRGKGLRKKKRWGDWERKKMGRKR